MKINETIEITQGNCIDLLSKVKGGSVNTIIIDPPYFLGMTHNGQKGSFNDLAICKPFYKKLFEAFKRVLKTDGCVYFFTDWRAYAFYYPIFDSVLQAKNMLVWDKHGRPTVNKYGYGTELILFTGKINKSYVSNIIKDIKSFNSGAKKTNGEKVHPTQKPIELIEKFILDSTKEGDTVLDAFMGSGTTGVACHNTGRKFIGFEIDDAYFNIAKTRLEKAVKDKELDFLFDTKGACHAG